MKIKWTNKISGEQGFVKRLNRKEKYFENTFDSAEAPTFSVKNGNIKKILSLLRRYCPDNIYEAVED